MRILIAEDHEISRKILKIILTEFGDCDVVVDGEEAVLAFEAAWDESAPYDLICLDIMMPNMNGQEALRRIRALEKTFVEGESERVNIIMVSALGDSASIMEACYHGMANGYLVKPIQKDKLVREFYNLGLLAADPAE